MDFDIYEDDEPLPPPRGQRLVYRIVIGAVIVGLLYLYGLQSGFLFQRTGERVVQEPIASYDGTFIDVPIRAVVVVDAELQGSQRFEEDITRLVGNADIIWEQAGIDLSLATTQFLTLTDAETQSILTAPRTVSDRAGPFDGITVLLTQTLSGLNGVAFIGADVVAVADYTTSFDFRVLAHEIGHVLGLAHTTDTRLLMVSGGRGVALTDEEITTARGQAEAFAREEQKGAQIGDSAQAPTTQPNEVSLADNERFSTDEIVALTNQARIEASLEPLVVNSKLVAAARARVLDMAYNNYFAHTAPDGRTLADFLAEVGYAYTDAGENLAVGRHENDIAIVAAWLLSDGHRDNILGDFNETGIAIAEATFGNDTTWFVVQLFGASR